MTTLARMVALFAWTAAMGLSVSAGADYEGASGYDAPTPYEIDVSHDGYPRGDQPPGGQIDAAAEAPDYVVIEIEEGVAEEVDGETVIVVQEPEPIAATDVEPPPPREVAVEQPFGRCPDGIWVDGYWSYGDGEYVWVDGHCVVERVNYVFVHPRWDFYGSVWWFVPGYYRPCSVWVGFGYPRPWYWFPPYYNRYYRGYRGVPVHRGVPRRPIVRRPVSGPSVRGATPTTRIPTVGRQAPRSDGRTTTVNRAPSRTTTVGRAPTRAPTVNRAPPTRAPTVSRAPTRAPTVNRAPPTRAPTVSRAPTRAPTVNRAPPTRAPSVTRQRPTEAPTVSRVGRGPVVTGTVPRSRPSVVRRPPVNPTRTTSVARAPDPRQSSTGARLGGFGSRQSSRPSATSAARRPSFGNRPSSGLFGRANMGSSRPSMGPRPSFGRPGGGLGRPSSGGFGGARSVPTARGR